MRILLLGERSSNTLNWMVALQSQPDVDVVLWSMRRLPRAVALLTILLAIYQIRRKIKKVKPDLVIAYRTTSYGFLGACSGFQPLVIAAQGDTDVWPPGHWTSFITSLMARYAIRKAVLIHAWADHMTRSLYDLGASAGKLLVKHRGIILANFPFRQPFTIANEIRFICTRSLFPEYHHELIFHALKKLENHLSEIQFTLYVLGDGIMKSELRNLKIRLGILSKIEWVGKVSPNEVGLWLQKADIYISLPETEGVSSSLLEAMACGCYPVVTDLPANRLWIRNEENGRLVSLDVDDIVKACIDVVNNRYLLGTAIQANRKLIENEADASKNNAQFVEHYRKLLR